jgi:hypothetical protein
VQRSWIEKKKTEHDAKKRAEDALTKAGEY